MSQRQPRKVDEMTDDQSDELNDLVANRQRLRSKVEEMLTKVADIKTEIRAISGRIAVLNAERNADINRRNAERIEREAEANYKAWAIKKSAILGEYYGGGRPSMAAISRKHGVSATWVADTIDRLRRRAERDARAWDREHNYTCVNLPHSHNGTALISKYPR